MENEETRNKCMKVLEIPFSPSSSSETDMSSSSLNHSAGAAGGGLTRQGSLAKTNNCLCSPTTHAGSFRCRLHRTPVSLQRTKSMDSSSSSLSSPVKDDSPHSNSKPTTGNESTVVQAQ